VRPPVNDGECDQHVKSGQQQAWDEAGGEQLGNRQFGDGGVDDQDDRRRDENVGAAAGGDAAGRGLPPEKWSSLMYGLWPDGGLKNAKEETHG